MLQVERVGRVLNMTLLADRIALCCVLVNVVRLLLLWVKHAPEMIDRVPFYKPMERLHGTTITLTGASAVKEISNSQAFYADFGHSFEAIQVASSGTLQLCQQKTLCCSDNRNWFALRHAFFKLLSLSFVASGVALFG